MQRDIVVMAEYPWLVYQSAGYKAVTIPSDKEAVCEVVRKYEVNYLLLPIPESTAQTPDNSGISDCTFFPVMDITSLGVRLFGVVYNE